MSQTRQIDVIIDGKHIMSKGHRIDLKIDGKKVYSTEDTCQVEDLKTEDFDRESIEYFLRVASSAFDHVDRFRMMKYIAESPKSFTEIKKLLEAQSPTTNFHLKVLIDETLVYKNEHGKYALTLMGKLVLEYFAGFLKEANCLRDVLNQEVRVK